jgi:hypothetical protein
VTKRRDPDRTVVSFRPEGTVIWEAPEDFTKEELGLFVEICANGELNYNEAIGCVQRLRK